MHAQNKSLYDESPANETMKSVPKVRGAKIPGIYKKETQRSDEQRKQVCL